MHLRVIKAINAPYGRRDVELALRAYLQQVEPQLMRWLRGVWGAQQAAITYQEIRDAILAGTLGESWLWTWQVDYAQLVMDKITPAWIDAMEAAAERFKEQAAGFVFDPAWPEVRRWIEDHGGELVSNLAAVQHEALKQVIGQAALLGAEVDRLGNPRRTLGPDELSRVMRPLIGLAQREAAAVMRFYDALRQDGMKADQAQKKALNYSHRLHRHRAMRIARTELVWAYNQGALAGALQAQAQGYLGRFHKVWLTAADERVCSICGPLDEVRVPEGALFPGGYETPPAHPHCRCAVSFEPVN